ncbi:hypothetical protein ABBQ38_014638 [Trebouxia sp. C0009 RCD-2024]
MLHLSGATSGFAVFASQHNDPRDQEADSHATLAHRALHFQQQEHRLSRLKDKGGLDSSTTARCQRSNAEAVRQAIQGGVTLVQLRERDADGGAFIREAEQVMQVANESGPCFRSESCYMKNIKLQVYRVDVALAVGAHGVHVGLDDIPARTAQQLLGPGKVLGVSECGAGAAGS